MSRVAARKPTLAVVIAAAVVAVGAGAAFAYWTSSGSGTGTAGTGTDTAFTITSTTAGDPLMPGGPTQTATFVVTNPGSGIQHLTGATLIVATSTGAAWTAVEGCSAADYTVGAPVITAGDISPGGTLTGTATITMNNLPSDQDACQGVVVPLYFTAN